MHLQLIVSVNTSTVADCDEILCVPHAQTGEVEHNVPDVINLPNWQHAVMERGRLAL